jgi:hypothetical protein
MNERVSDPLDRATQLEEAERLSAAAYRKPTLKRIGKCYACGEVTPPQALFCDADCTEWYERDQAARARNGRR